MSRRQSRSRRRSLLARSLLAFVWLAMLFVGLSLLLVLPWRWLPPPTSSFMLQASTRDVGPPHYRWIDYTKISPQMALAVVAAEDQRFPDHNGFDLEEIRNALSAYRAGKPLRGASTLSQQVAKNLYLWPGRSLARKALEAWFTILLEQLWSKRRILEIHLNIAQFGDGLFGVEATSQHFFGQSAATLSAEQAALLAAVLPAPVRYHIDRPSEQVRNRQHWILKQMRQLGGPAYLQKL